MRGEGRGDKCIRRPTYLGQTEALIQSFVSFSSFVFFFYYFQAFSSLSLLSTAPSWLPFLISSLAMRPYKSKSRTSSPVRCQRSLLAPIQKGGGGVTMNFF